MRKIVGVVVAVLLVVPGLALAQDSDEAATVAKGLIETSALQQSAVTANNSALTASGRHISGSWSLRLQDANAQSAPTEERSWPVRHPVLFGSLVGAGVGVVAGTAWCGGEQSEFDCSLYALTLGGIGATFGAGTGLIVSKKDWVRRHSVVFATLMGATAGFLGGAAACPAYPPYNESYSCTVRGLTYAGVGAGLGAGAGWIATLVRR